MPPLPSHRQMVSLYRAEELHEEQDRIARALGAATDVALLNSALEFAISDDVRSQVGCYERRDSESLVNNGSYLFREPF